MIPLLRVRDINKGISERLALWYVLRSEVLDSAIYSLDTIDLYSCIMRDEGAVTIGLRRMAAPR
jgi:hypothetical protein